MCVVRWVFHNFSSPLNPFCIGPNIYSALKCQPPHNTDRFVNSSNQVSKFDIYTKNGQIITSIDNFILYVLPGVLEHFDINGFDSG